MIKNQLYNTEPLIFHAQGKPKFCYLWDEIKALCNNQKNTPNDLSIVTFNNGQAVLDKEPGCLERSVQNQCEVLGRGISKWKNSMKIELIIEFLERCRSEYVLSLDSSDVVVYSLDRILDLFCEKQCDLLYNAELHVWPHESDVSRWEKATFRHPFCYLNAGAWIGKRTVALEFYKDCLNHIVSNSEQAAVKDVYRNWYPRILIDDSCVIFQTLNRVDSQILQIGN